jgi:hypothetical protein
MLQADEIKIIAHILMIEVWRGFEITLSASERYKKKLGCTIP